MAIKTQESQVYFIDPSTTPATVVELVGVTKIDGIDAPISSVESTTLASKHRDYTPGIAEPSTASISILSDPSEDSQTTLHALRNAGTVLHWAVGSSDGTAAPALDTDGKAFKQDAVARTFLYFDGFATSWTHGYDVNGVATNEVGAQLVNIPELVAKVAA